MVTVSNPEVVDGLLYFGFCVTKNSPLIQLLMAEWLKWLDQAGS
jgi:hypothetical protein